MHYPSIISVALLAVALPLFTTAEHHGPSRRHHNELANRKRTATELLQWNKRESNARMTFYDVGLGACRKPNVASDFIVALNSCQFSGGAHCFEMITITFQGKSTQAQIMDECPGCPCGGLDMSRGLFTFFAPESVGVFYADWSFNDGSGGGNAPAAAPPPDPAPTSSKKPAPTSTWTPPATTSSWVDPSPWTSETTSSTKTKTSSSSSSSSTSWSSSSTSSSVSHSSSSSSSTPSAYATPTPASISNVATTPQNLQGLNSLVVTLGKFVTQHGS